MNFSVNCVLHYCLVRLRNIFDLQDTKSIIQDLYCSCNLVWLEELVDNAVKESE
jgi:hypothetical protein